MTDHHHDTTSNDANRADIHGPVRGVSHRHGGHGLMMIACCIPMLAIAGVLVVTGVASVGFLLFAVACTAMMALMMRGMHAGGQAPSARQEPTASPFDKRYK
jgi:hypothetical protein